MALANRINIDAAARKIAHKHGLKVRYRESWNSVGERLVRWVLQDAAGKVTHELQLVCADGAAFAWNGWASGVTLFRCGNGQRDAQHQSNLVDATLQLRRRAATALTYARFVEWADRYPVSA